MSVDLSFLRPELLLYLSENSIEHLTLVVVCTSTYLGLETLDIRTIQSTQGSKCLRTGYIREVLVSGLSPLFLFVNPFCIPVSTSRERFLLQHETTI